MSDADSFNGKWKARVVDPETLSVIVEGVLYPANINPDGFNLALVKKFVQIEQPFGPRLNKV